MGRRGRKHRKRFACGHRGFGKLCHYCASMRSQQRSKSATHLNIGQLQTSVRQQWQRSFALDVIELMHLPKSIVLKARDILSKLSQGVEYWRLRGRRLRSNREVVRIPVSYRYRLLCRTEDDTVRPWKVLSHEDYNSLVRHKNRL